MLLGAHQNIDDRPRLLILEDDEDVLFVMLEGINRPCMSIANHLHERASKELRCCDCSASHDRPCAQIIRSLRELHQTHLEDWDVLICATCLPDGSGLDALAYVRGTRPELPVILVGPAGESVLAIEAIRSGAADFLLTVGGNLLTLPLAVEKCLAQQRIKRENERLQRDLSRSLSETAVKNRQLQLLIQQLETMARTDELTGLCNRRWFNLMLNRSWAEALRVGSPLAFAMLDLDMFKHVNDARGHQRGDELLRLAGRVIEANSRDVDLPARYGGDEFCILMPHTKHEEAGQVIQRIASAFKTATDALGGNEAELSMSVGMSHISLSRPENADQLILHADEALYAAKSAGKGQIMIRDRNGVARLQPTPEAA